MRSRLLVAALMLAGIGVAGCTSDCDHAASTLHITDFEIVDHPVLRSGGFLVNERPVADSHGFVIMAVKDAAANEDNVVGLQLELRVDGTLVPVDVTRVDSQSSEGRGPDDGGIGNVTPGRPTTLWFAAHDGSSLRLPVGKNATMAVPFNGRDARCSSRSAPQQVLRASTIVRPVESDGPIHVAGNPSLKRVGDSYGVRIPVTVAQAEWIGNVTVEASSWSAPAQRHSPMRGVMAFPKVAFDESAGAIFSVNDAHAYERTGSPWPNATMIAPGRALVVFEYDHAAGDYPPAHALGVVEAMLEQVERA